MRTADRYVTARIHATLAKAGVDTFTGGTVLAYVNHGRWVADCPCNGAELVAPGMLMVCGSCGAEHKVTFPKNRKAIEAALEPRAEPNQNWSIGQSPDDLWAENISHGLYPDDLKAG